MSVAEMTSSSLNLHLHTSRSKQQGNLSKQVAAAVFSEESSTHFLQQTAVASQKPGSSGSSSLFSEASSTQFLQQTVHLNNQVVVVVAVSYLNHHLHTSCSKQQGHLNKQVAVAVSSLKRKSTHFSQQTAAASQQPGSSSSLFSEASSTQFSQQTAPKCYKNRMNKNASSIKILKLKKTKFKKVQPHRQN